MIGLHDCTKDRVWDQDEIDLLSVAANSIVLGLKNEEIRKSLAKSEKKYKAIFENTGNASVILDQDHNIVLANNEFCRLSKFSKEEILGKKNIKDLISKGDRDFVTENQRMLSEGEENAIRNYEIKIKDRDKKTKDFYMSVGMIPNPELSIASLENVSFIKKIAQENKLFKAIIEKSNNCIHIVDSDFNISYINEYLAKTLGYGQLDLIGTKIGQLHLKKQMSYMKKLRKDLKHCKSFENTEILYKHKNGDLIPMRVNGFIMDDEFKNKKYWVMMSANMSKQKEMIEKLEESEKWDRTIFETSSSAMAITDED